ncbi:uncharacterized protein BO66DRAFT_396215 [Aspergillus aculeatinus CBS 121060]|uniref:Uncharacterized protein n=1 Tax=Aspergillus aculeatinus CBS 121060 TaxID=1448322 RepID=A0ACD1GTC2_9EURO|nr:hypothetical protein BO66DRAFT_396215 [Aspergillus aculeatinus CBS 121060]RAH64378.1 hypothetical protein BO66DRAFT_396215 [Aspergillus aculeatinus CBS 121060]
MAHQVDGICWDALTSNLVFQSHPSADVSEATNLYFRFRPQQGQEIGQFAESLAHAIASETERERRKYPARYDPPQRDDIILADEVAHKVQPLAYAWCQNDCWEFGSKVTNSPDLCRHVESEGFACGCPLPYRERLGSAFLRQYQHNDCFEFFRVNGDAFFNLQVVNALLVLGEMDPVLRLCAHPAIGLREWMEARECWDTDSEVGWDQVFEATLDFYLLLNILDSFRELRAHSSPGSDDYRDTKMYQRTLFLWTQMHSQAEVPSQFHRRFFGLEDHFEAPFTIERQFHLPIMAKLLAEEQARVPISVPLHNEDDPYEPCLFLNEDNFPFGKVPFEVFLTCDTDAPYHPSASDIARVEAYLRHKGLPQELVLDITTWTEYDRPRNRLPVPHDPLHVGNRTVLEKYLDECFRIMVRCNMLAQELGMEIHWPSRVVHALDRLVSSPTGQKLFVRSQSQIILQGGDGELPWSTHQ